MADIKITITSDQPLTSEQKNAIIDAMLLEVAGHGMTPVNFTSSVVHDVVSDTGEAITIKPKGDAMEGFRLHLRDPRDGFKDKDQALILVST